MLKGGGCENMNAQYSLPHPDLGGRDLKGVENAILDCVLQAQGQGCGPGILGVCIGGDRGTGYGFAKEQLLRMLDDTNPDPVLAELEAARRREGESVRHRPDGLRRQDHAAGLQDRQAQSPAGVVLRLDRVHVLGVPAAGAARRRNVRVAVLKAMLNVNVNATELVISYS